MLPIAGRFSHGLVNLLCIVPILAEAMQSQLAFLSLPHRSEHQQTFLADHDFHVNPSSIKLTWLVLGEDPAARSHRVEQFTAL
jgi:hypothetical protein